MSTERSEVEMIFDVGNPLDDDRIGDGFNN